MNYKHKIDACFDYLVEVAKRGDRCPKFAELKDKSYPVDGPRILALLGRIRVEVWAKKWRVIEIMEGPAKGQRTAESPCGLQPYKVIENHK